jgi:endonuclease YncB( thermonuclease family)
MTRWISPAQALDLGLSASVHDGDTVWLTLDRGFRDFTTKDLRLKGVYAPELSQPGGAETRSFVIDWLQEAAILSANVTPWPLSVETFKTRTGNDVQTLNRYVAMVYAGDPEAVRAGPGFAQVPCLNRDVIAFLAAHPEWGHGIGSI